MSKDNKMLMFDKWYVTACFWGHEWNLGVRWSLQGPQYIPYTDGDGIPWAKPNDTFVVLRFCGATKSVQQIKPNAKLPPPYLRFGKTLRRGSHVSS